MGEPEARILIGASPVGADRRHTYLLFESSNGEQTVIRGGPSRNPDGDALAALADSTLLGSDRYGSIRVDAMPYKESVSAYVKLHPDGEREYVPVEMSDGKDPEFVRTGKGLLIAPITAVDWPLPGEHHERRVLWTGSDAELQAKLGAARQAGQQITNAGMEYSPLSNNCNNVSTALLNAVGVKPELPTRDDGTRVSAPAFGEPLYQDIGVGSWRSGYRFDGKTWKDDDGQTLQPPMKGEATERLDKAAPSRSGSFNSAQHEAPARDRSSMLDPGNADHGLYLQAYAGVVRLDERIGRTPDLQSQQLAAALTAQSKADGLGSIQQVLLNDNGTRAFAVDNADAAVPWARRSAVEVLAAVQQPLEVSDARLEQTRLEQATLHSNQQQNTAAMDAQAPAAPRLV